MKRKNVSPGEPPASKRANLSVATVGGPSSSTDTPKMPKNKQASVSTPTAVSTPSVEKPSSKRELWNIIFLFFFCDAIMKKKL